MPRKQNANSLKNLEKGRLPGIKTDFNSETARLAGIKSGQVRKAKAQARKSMRQTLDILLSKAIRKGNMVTPEDIQDLANAEDLNVDAITAISIAMIQRAMLGDVQASQYIRDTIGEKPTDKVEVDQSLTIESWAKTHKPKL